MSYKRIALAVSVLTLLSIAVWAEHDASPPRTPTVNPRTMQISGAARDVFSRGAETSPTRPDLGFGRTPRYFDQKTNPFDTYQRARLSVSPWTRNFRSLGPITHHTPSLRSQTKPKSFQNIEEKIIAAGGRPQPALGIRTLRVRTTP